MTDPAPDDRSGRFTMDDAGVVVGQSLLCRHRAESGLGGAACAAFPSTIPFEILDNAVDHRKPYEGDQGIHFEPDPDAPPGLVRNLHRYLDSLPRR
jgi:hypothetical protein